jgi:curli production assembly/transport component CsgE
MGKSKLFRNVFFCCTLVCITPRGFTQSNLVQVEDNGTSPLHAQALGENQLPFNDFNEVSGVVVDRTITRLGEDFYFFFTQQLNAQYPDLTENLTVKEIPTALSGSIIEVIHARRAIYRTALSPGRRQAKERAQEALRVVGNYIVRWEAERLFQDTYDLEHDEF